MRPGRSGRHGGAASRYAPGPERRARAGEYRAARRAGGSGPGDVMRRVDDPGAKRRAESVGRIEAPGRRSEAPGRKRAPERSAGLKAWAGAKRRAGPGAGWPGGAPPCGPARSGSTLGVGAARVPSAPPRGDLSRRHGPVSCASARLVAESRRPAGGGAASAAGVCARPLPCDGGAVPTRKSSGGQFRAGTGRPSTQTRQRAGPLSRAVGLRRAGAAGRRRAQGIRPTSPDSPAQRVAANPEPSTACAGNGAAAAPSPPPGPPAAEQPPGRTPPADALSLAARPAPP